MSYPVSKVREVALFSGGYPVPSMKKMSNFDAIKWVLLPGAVECATYHRKMELAGMVTGVKNARNALCVSVALFSLAMGGVAKSHNDSMKWTFVAVSVLNASFAKFFAKRLYYSIKRIQTFKESEVCTTNTKKVTNERSCEPPLLWSELSNEEKMYGVHPEKLKILKFDISETELNTTELFDQLDRFFLGCRAATSDSEFRSISADLLNSNESLIIKTVIVCVPSIQMPTEHLIEDISSFYFDGIQGDGCEDNDYKTKFKETYNDLINQGRSYLMHPARIEELVAYLGDKFPDASLAADRLTIYRCCGPEKLQEIENSQEITETAST